jgi:hypothetical protein
MSTHEFEFDAFEDNFSLAVDEASDWPSLSVELTLKWHPAEPDVGIFSSQPECVKVLYFLDGETFSDEDAFAAAVYDRIGDEIEETVEAVAKVIRDQVNDWEHEAEEE